MFQLLYHCYKLHQNNHLLGSRICGSGIQIEMTCLSTPQGLRPQLGDLKNGSVII